MRRKLVGLVFSLLILGSIGLPVFAAGGTIRVEIGGAGEVTLYKVGEADGAGYRLSDSCGGGYLTFDDVLSDELAAWLAQRASNGAKAESVDGTAEFTNVGEGLYLVVQTGLREGYYAFRPFLITVPWDGNIWEIEAKPKMQQTAGENPRTGDTSVGYYALFGMAASLMGIVGCLVRKSADFQKRY